MFRRKLISQQSKREISAFFRPCCVWFTPNLGFACNFSTLQEEKELKQGVKIVFLFFTFFVQNVVKKKKIKSFACSGYCMQEI